MKSLGRFVVAAAALTLLAAPAWAQNRTDIPDFAQSFIQIVPADANGNVNVNALQIGISGAGAGVQTVGGYAAKIVATPNLDEIAGLRGVVFEPDNVTRGTGSGSKSKLKQSNQAGIALQHGTTLNGPATFTISAAQQEGCKAKVKATGLNSISGLYANGGSVVTCSQEALAALVPNAALRTRIQQLVGTAGGQGVQAIIQNAQPQ